MLRTDTTQRMNKNIVENPSSSLLHKNMIKIHDTKSLFFFNFCFMLLRHLSLTLMEEHELRVFRFKDGMVRKIFRFK